MGFADSWNKLTDGFNGLVEGGKGLAGDALDTVRDNVPGIRDIGEFVGGLSDRARDLWNGGKDTAIESALGMLPDGAINIKIGAGQQALGRVVQQGLNALGYNVGAVDGLPGKGTLRALNTFLKEQGMDALNNISEFKGEHLSAMVSALSDAGKLSDLRGSLLDALARNVPQFSIPGMDDIRDALKTSAVEQPAPDVAVVQSPPPAGPGGLA